MKWLNSLRNWWNGLDEEAQEQVKPEGVSRRSFLKLMGVTTTSVYLGGTATNALWTPEPKQLVLGERAIAETQLLNQHLLDAWAVNDPLLEQAAINAVNDFTRQKMREDGFYRKILPPIQISNYELELATNGKLSLQFLKGKKRDIRVVADLDYMAVKPTSKRLAGYIMG